MSDEKPWGADNNVMHWSRDKPEPWRSAIQAAYNVGHDDGEESAAVDKEFKYEDLIDVVLELVDPRLETVNDCGQALVDRRARLEAALRRAGIPSEPQP